MTATVYSFICLEYPNIDQDRFVHCFIKVKRNLDNYIWLLYNALVQIMQIMEIHRHLLQPFPWHIPNLAVRARDVPAKKKFILKRSFVLTAVSSVIHC